MAASNHKLLKKNAMSGAALVFTVFCCVSGGPFGLEPVVSEAGPGVGLLLILLLPFVWALPDALTSCELAPAIPVEGGYVVWVRRAMGEFAGFLNAWWTWIYTLVDAAIYPVLFATYLSMTAKTLWGSDALAGEFPQWLISLTMIAVFAFMNIRGTRVVGRTATVLGLTIIVPFVLFVVVGALKLIGEPRSVDLSLPRDPDALRSSLAAGLGIVMWNYLGWDALSTIAEEVEDPARSYPRALLTGIVTVTLVYALPTLIGLYYFPVASDWVEGAWPAIAEAAGGKWLWYAMTVAALASPIALFTASLLASSRVPFVLAERRFLPQPFVELHPRFGTPWIAITFSAVVFAVLALKTFQELVVLNVSMYGAALVLETTALLVLRKTEPDLPRPFRIPGGWPVLALLWVLPVGMVAALIVLSIQEEGWPAQYLTLAAILSGPIVYMLVRAMRKVPTD